MGKFKKFWLWLKKNAWWILIGLVILVLTIISVVVVNKGMAVELKKMALKLRRTQAERDVAYLEGTKDVNDVRVAEVDDKIKNNNDKLKKINDTIAAVDGDVGSMTAQEKLDKFKNIGY